MANRTHFLTGEAWQASHPPEVRRGNTKAKTHGMGSSSEYRAWTNAKRRCYAPSYVGFKNYGGRGIAMCAEWLNDFAAFLAHIGPKPAPGLQLDRINNEGDYEPGNVRWVTPKEQANNRRRPVRRVA